MHLKRDKFTGALYQSAFKKRLSKTYDKRVILRNYDTYAYGSKYIT